MPRGEYNERIREEKQEKILKAAAKVYAHYGFEGATIDRMAAEAGVSKAMVLHYYKSKQGIVMAIANRAVRENMESIHRIDENQKLTLRQREQRLHEIIRPAREEWCLILGTLLVPSFQFQQRGEIAGYLTRNHKYILDHHLHELREPDSDTAYACAHNTVGAHITYILGGNEDNYRRAMSSLLDLYLRPEDEILSSRDAHKNQK